MSKKVVVTVLGQDRVGIVAAIATALAENQVNIEDINQKILGGSIFAMTMLTDLANCPLDLAELSRRLEAVGEELGLKVMTQDAEVFRYMHRV
ncbi:MAG: ACT domain-containing protein [Deltaproteobacteria bacterium]|nr:ACT domain-containing protein [Deltaproteobacteria bacterium]